MKRKQTITVIGKRWFDRQYGNTYHTVVVFHDGKEVGRAPLTYGYDRHYEQTALEIIKKFGTPTMKRRAAAVEHCLWKLKDFYNVINEVTDVTRKKDL